MNENWLSLMQVASVSGDLRRCLELLRRAAEIADEQLDTVAQTAGSAGAAVTAGGDVKVVLLAALLAAWQVVSAAWPQLGTLPQYPGALRR